MISMRDAAGRYQNYRRKNDLGKCIAWFCVPLYLLFVGLDIFWPSAYLFSAWIKWESILLVAVMQILFLPYVHFVQGQAKPVPAAEWTAIHSSRLLWVVAGCLTVCADFFLLLTQQFQWGLWIFVLVQLLRLYALWATKVVFAALVLPLLPFLRLWAPAWPDLVGPALFYAALLLTLLFSSLRIYRGAGNRPRLNKRSFVWGMLLFLACDINVLCFNLAPQRGWAAVLMWVFYLPSQILLALSLDSFPHAAATKIHGQS